MIQSIYLPASRYSTSLIPSPFSIDRLGVTQIMTLVDMRYY